MAKPHRIVGKVLPSARYDPDYFGELFAIEDRHFWFRTRNRIISTLVAQIVKDLPAPYRVLEVGCGTGSVLRMLEQTCSRGTVVGMDVFEQGLHFARRRTACPLVQGDAGRHPFASSFHVVGLFDVLEHMPDDQALLRDIRRLLAPGGWLLLTVPARRSLWSYFDEASGHCRRYEEEELADKLIRAGFRIDYITPYMLSLWPFLWCGRRVAGLTRRFRTDSSSKKLLEQELRILPVLNGVLTFTIGQEARWIAARRQLPFGTSLLALARCPLQEKDGG